MYSETQQKSQTCHITEYMRKCTFSKICNNRVDRFKSSTMELNDFVSGV